MNTKIMPKEILMIDNLTYDELLLLQNILQYIEETQPCFADDPDFEALYDKVMVA